MIPQPRRMPTAEVAVPAGLLRSLLADQHPDLADRHIELMANGWDNLMFRLGDDLIARLPRREVAARLVMHEQLWLPVLAPRLPLAVPAPVRVGQPGHGYPWAWSIVPFIPGRLAADSPPVNPGEAAVSLGEFLAALHAPAAPQAPVHTSRGVPLAERSAVLAENLELLGDLVDRQMVRRLWEAAVAAPPWDGARLWLHGDLHPANILVHDGRISGVIDFGDITSGDPAADLSVAWMLLPAEQHDEVRAAYRAAGGLATDENTWMRAKGWALALSIVFLAHSADNPQIHRIGCRTLEAVLADPWLG